MKDLLIDVMQEVELEVMNRELLKRAELVIMDRNDYRGTRDFVLVDHEQSVFYTGSTHSMSLDVRAAEIQVIVKRKKDLKALQAQLINRGYDARYAREL